MNVQKKNLMTMTIHLLHLHEKNCMLSALERTSTTPLFCNFNQMYRDSASVCIYLSMCTLTHG